jgi:hypothetical protein
MRALSIAPLMFCLVAACAVPPAAVGPTPQDVAVTPTATAPPPSPVVTIAPATLATVTLQPPVTPFAALAVRTSVDNALLRDNPGYLFPPVAVLKQGADLLVVARSPGGEWLFCQTPDHRAGWVFAQLIDAGSGDVEKAPVIWPSSTQVVVGMLRDRLGVPISGMQFAIVQGAGTRPPRNDAMTDATGTFYAFMPEDAAGTWTVSYTAVSCKSNVMDASCSCISGRCGMPDPMTVDITLPRSSQDVLAFTLR